MKTATAKAAQRLPLENRRKDYLTALDLYRWTVISEKKYPKFDEFTMTRWGVTRDGVVIWCEDRIAAELLIDALQCATGEGRS